MAVKMATDGWAMVGVVLLALAVRLGMGIFLGFNAPPDREACGADAVEFEQMAWSAAQGGHFALTPGGPPTAFRAPGYPAMLSLLYRLFGRTYAANRVAQSLLGAATCWLTWLLARRLEMRPTEGLLAALLVALLPLQFYFCGHFMSEPLATFLNVACTLLLVTALRGRAPTAAANSGGRGLRRAQSSRLASRVPGRMPGRMPGRAICFESCGLPSEALAKKGSASVALQGPARGSSEPHQHTPQRLGLMFAAGIVGGLSALVRPAGLLLLPVLCGLLAAGGLVSVFRHPPRPSGGPSIFRQMLRHLLPCATFGIGFVLVLAPWTLRNWVCFSRFCPIASNGGSTFWGANNALVARPMQPLWGSWISTGVVDRDRKQREVLILANEVDRDRKEWSFGIEYLCTHLTDVPWMMVGKTYRLLTPLIKSPNKVFTAVAGAGQLVLLPLFILGLLTVLRSPTDTRRFAPVIAQLLTMLATALVFYGSERFRAPYEPLVSLFAGGFAARCAVPFARWASGRPT